MNKHRLITLSVLILAAAVTRLLPHPSNFAPITAIALFGGTQLSRRSHAFLIPLGAMFLSDCLLGFHPQMPSVYLSFALVVLIGCWVRGHKTPLRIAEGALGGSILFFVLTNFSVWAFDALYPRTAAGLVACFAAALPFFHNSLLGDASYTVVLFGGLALAERWFPVLREAPVAFAHTV